MSCHDRKTMPPCMLPLLSSRRTFLKQSAVAAAVAAALPACEFAESYVEGKAFAFNINDEAFSSLQTVGQVATLDVDAETKLLLVRVSESEVFAFDRICPHADWDMDPAIAAPLDNEWLQEEQVLKCGLHGSRFGANGQIVMGPSTVPISRYEVTFDASSGEGSGNTGAVVMA